MRCLQGARQLRAHIPREADAEMQAAGVGAALPADPNTVSLHEAAEQPSRQQRRSRSAPPVAPIRLGTQRRSQHRRHTPISADRGAILLAEPPREAWELLDAIDLPEWFRIRRPTLQSCPRFLRGRYRHAQRLAMEEIDRAIRDRSELAERRGWKALGLLSVMLLHRPHLRGSVGKSELEDRFERFAKGEWPALLDSARACARGTRHVTTRSPEDERRPVRRYVLRSSGRHGRP